MSDLSIRRYFPFCRVRIVRQSVDDAWAWIEMEPDKRFRPVCHVCGQPAERVHSTDVRTVRDLDFGQNRVWVNSRCRKIVCEHCDGIRMEDLGLFDPYQRVTRRLARAIYGMCQVMTVQDVAAHYKLDWKTVKNIDKEFLEQQNLHPSFDGLRLLAVDEIAIRKGHRYMTVVLDYETGRVVWMDQDRTVETLKTFFDLLTESQKASIEAVAMDMWKPYIRATREGLPQARIVFDLYHVVREFNKVIDRVRLDEYRRASAQDRTVYAGSKYLLLSNRENLTTPGKRDHLKRLLELNRTLSTVMILKEMLKRIWRYTSRWWADRELTQWCALARTLDHPAVHKFADMLEAHREGILNHCQYPIHTGKLEGVNNKIKVIKRKAYGFHDQRYFSLKVIQAFAVN